MNAELRADNNEPSRWSTSTHKWPAVAGLHFLALGQVQVRSRVGGFKAGWSWSWSWSRSRTAGLKLVCQIKDVQHVCSGRRLLSDTPEFKVDGMCGLRGRRGWGINCA